LKVMVSLLNTYELEWRLSPRAPDHKSDIG
jgi:hypothetical protein